MSVETRVSPIQAESDILKQSLIGVRQWLIREWRSRVSNPDIEVIFASRYAGDKTIDLLTDRDPNTRIPVPNVVIVPTMIGKGMDRWNSFALRQLGLHTGFINGRQSARREKVIPIDVGLGVRATCNDVWEVMMLGQIWAENLPDAKINVYQGDTGFTFRATLQPDPGSFNIPQDEQAGEGAMLQADSTLILKTMSGTTELTRLVRKTQSNFRDMETGQNYGSTISDGYKQDKGAGWPKPAGGQ